MRDTDTLVDDLDRWEASGGHWTLMSSVGDRLVFGLLTCDGGEVMSQASGQRTAALEEFLAGRTSSED